MKDTFTFDAHDVLEVHPESLGEDYIDWGLNIIMAPEAWKRTKGEGAKVAVLDTGVDLTHPDLQSNIKAAIDFTGSPYQANDMNGHGTHCAGIIAGVDNGIGIVGVAPHAELHCAKVLSDNGAGNFESIIKGIEWAIAQNVHVISMSLGTNMEPPEELHQAIKRAHDQGIIIVAACGNENGQVSWPARYDEVIAVSALDKTFNRANFSNYGIKNEIIAPGVDILSTYKGHQYARLSGTSMATPIIAGAAALFIADCQKRSGRRPSLEETHKALDQATVDLGQTGKDDYFGLGLINLAKLFKEN